jgi:hypothetical protein
MLTLKIRLVRPAHFVTLELTEGRPLLRGTWRQLADESTASLRFRGGFWENWPHGVPGGVRTIRLYDPEEMVVAHLMDYLSGRIEGAGRFISTGFGGEFGEEEFAWTLVRSSPLRTASADLPPPDIAEAASARARSVGRWKGY